MASNIKVAIATGDAVLTYVEDDTTVGSNGTADANIPSTTRIALTLPLCMLRTTTLTEISFFQFSHLGRFTLFLSIN